MLTLCKLLSRNPRLPLSRRNPIRGKPRILMLWQKSSSAITQPAQTDPWKTAGAARSVQTDPAKVMAYAVPAADSAKAMASAVPAADLAKATVSALPAADPAKAMAVPAADPRKSKTKTSAAAKQKVSTSDFNI